MAEINKSDIKLFESQTLTDDTEGGGARTNNEVVSGQMNNLFTDSSRMDRVYGRVSLRKSFPAVITTDRAIYYGSHIMLTKSADDPLVTCWFFTTEDWFDQRSAAASRIEGYLVKGPTFGAGLLGDHFQGTSVLNLQSNKNWDDPEVGDVLVLETSKNLAGATIDTLTQYVRIMDVSSEVQEFVGLDSQGNSVTFEKKIITIEIGTVLESDFPGRDASYYSNYSAWDTVIYTSVVADSSRFYSISPLIEEAAAGELEVRVADVKLAIVPSATSETGIVDFSISPAENPIIQSDDAPSTINRSYSFSMTSGARLYVGEPVLRGSFTITSEGLTDNSQGDLLIAGVIVGTIAYDTGIIDWGTEATQGSATRTIQYVPACAPDRVAYGIGRYVTTANRGFTWVYYCDPVPVEGTVKVEFLSSGKWYTMWDHGGGLIRGSDAALGTGSVNYVTGSVNITLGELPDVNSYVMIYWAPPADYKDLSGESLEFYYEFDLTDQAIVPGTLTIDWTQNGAQQLADDNSDGNIYLNGSTGTVIGFIDYTTGHVIIDALPMTPTHDMSFTIGYDYGGSGAVKLDIFNNPTITNNRVTLNLSNTGSINPYSVSVDWTNITNSSYEASSSAPAYSRYTIFNPPSTKNFLYHDDGSGGFRDEVANGATNWSAGTIVYTAGAGVVEISPNRTETMPAAIYQKKAVQSYSSDDTSLYRQYAHTSTEDVATDVYPDPANYNINVSYTETVGSSSQSYSSTLTKKYKVSANTVLKIVSNSFHATINSIQIIDRLGNLYKNFGGETETVTQVGTINYTTREITITDNTVTSNSANITLNVSHCTGTSDIEPASGVVFRTPGAPVTPSSLSIKAYLNDNTQTTGGSNGAGEITGDYMEGTIDYDTGVVRLNFGEWVTDDVNAQAQDWYATENVSGGNVWKPISVDAGNILIACVVTSYLPLDADLLGLDPVRLPQDGRVPIFRDGQVICIHNTQNYTVSDNPIINTTYSVGRSPVSLLELYDVDGTYIPETDGYTVDLDNGQITVTDQATINGTYTGPFYILHRIEDMKLASDVQITGHIAVTSQLTFTYPATTSYVSTVLPMGDLQAKVTNKFDQVSWTSWADTVDDTVGEIDGASYDFLNYPIELVNADSTQERWSIRFTSTTNFNLVGEHLGTIATGNTGTNLAPTNPTTGNPYFTMLAGGWGSGWSSGNVVRFNTHAANYPIWSGRTTLQGAPTEFEDDFIMQIRGDSR
jgi:hypothetical protein